MEPRGKVIVVTGASSGMGRAAAVRFAARADSVVLAARRGAVLEEVASECERAGGRALSVPTDVTDERAVEDLARQAVARFGRIDAWVHAAAVAAFGRFGETPARVARQVIETNLTGTLYAAQAALAQFGRQGHGHLVLIASVLGKAPIPYLSAYNASKHGVVGLAGSIREELKADGLDGRIHVSTLLPPATDTPFYIHAANYTGKVPRPPPPVYSVDTLADAIVELVDEPEGVVTVGVAGKLMRAAHAVAPAVYDATIGPYAESMLLDESAPLSEGSVFTPMHEGRTPEGGWKDGTMLERREGR